jgi:hypothetical protein
VVRGLRGWMKLSKVVGKAYKVLGAGRELM